MKKIQSTEEVVSMFLGLVIVAVVVGLIFNFFQKKRGTVSLSGVSDQKNEIVESKDEKLSVGENKYEVVKGDSLWKISESQLGDGNRWVEIAKLNELKNPGQIEKGQKLVLPVTKVNKIEGDKYQVVKGDSLWKISVRAYGDGFQWVKIWQENKSLIAVPSKLEVGMDLKIPR